MVRELASRCGTILANVFGNKQNIVTNSVKKLNIYDYKTKKNDCAM